jgi:hypothetical protein
LGSSRSNIFGVHIDRAHFILLGADIMTLTNVPGGITLESCSDDDSDEIWEDNMDPITFLRYYATGNPLLGRWFGNMIRGCVNDPIKGIINWVAGVQSETSRMWCTIGGVGLGLGALYSIMYEGSRDETSPRINLPSISAPRLAVPRGLL